MLVRTLALAAVLAAPAAHADGGSLHVGVDVATDHGAAADATTWTEARTSWRPAVTASGAAATLWLRSTGAASEIEARLAYDAGALVDHEIVQLVVPGPARVLGHDLRLVTVGRAMRVDRPTPVLVLTPTMALVAEQGIVAAELVPHGDAVAVDLVLDDRASHPFSVYDRCLERLPSSPDWHALERRHPVDRLVRRARESVTARATLYRLDPAREALPLVVERWPAGARAAVVFTDHADRTDPAALRAVMYGAADATADSGRGFVGRGLRWTKSFFDRGGPGAIADPETRRLADALARDGSEIAVHSISAEADPRERVADGLGSFGRWDAVTWIDHEPYTNCEAVSSEGWRTDGPYGIRDVLVDGGVRWTWAAGDVPHGPLDLFASGPPLFPLPVDPRLWVFRSTWFSDAPAVLARTLDDAALDALERDRGLAVLHTYLSASPATTRNPVHRRALVVRAGSRGVLEIDPAFDSLLARLAARVAAGRLVVAPWRDVGDRLRALGDVIVRYGADGSATLEHDGGTGTGTADAHGTIRALAVSAPRPDLTLDVEGAIVRGRRTEADRSTVWFDLPALARVTVHATRDGVPVPFLPLDVVGTAP